MTDKELCLELRTLDVDEAAHVVCLAAAGRIERLLDLLVEAQAVAWNLDAELQARQKARLSQTPEALHDVLHKMQEEER